MIQEIINSQIEKIKLKNKRYKHLKFVGQRLYEMHSEITNESMELHKLSGKKFDHKVQRLVLLSSNIDRYKKYLRLITFLR